MTADELQSIARRLSNSSWCRYWLNWSDRTSPVTMAIQCHDASGVPQRVPDAISHGLEEREDFVYTATRTNDDGTIYESKLF